MQPLIEEAMKKAAVAWLSIPDGGTSPVWCLWVDDALYVVSGAQEQPAPGLAEADRAEVIVRGDHGGRILTWPAEVTRVEPGGAQWEQVVPQLAAKRLNAAGTTTEVIARWAQQCTVSRLRPDGEPVQAGASLPDSSGAAPPVPSPATRRTANPFRLHRVRRPPT